MEAYILPILMLCAVGLHAYIIYSEMLYHTWYTHLFLVALLFGLTVFLGTTKLAIALMTVPTCIEFYWFGRSLFGCEPRALSGKERERTNPFSNNKNE